MLTPQVAAMPRLITRIGTVLWLATCVGCESTSPSSAPSLLERTGPRWLNTLLTGTVYDTARRPLAEVHIGVAEGSRVGVSAVSDGAGHYELPGTFTGALVLRAEKPGYAPVTIGHQPPPFSGPSRRDIYLTNPETADVTGDWSVTLIANSSCTEIPEAIRTRFYRGSIRLKNYPPHHFDLKLQSDTLSSNWSNNISRLSLRHRRPVRNRRRGTGDSASSKTWVSRDHCSSGGRAADRWVTRRWLASSREGSNTRTTLARHRWESNVSPFNWKRSDGEPGAAVSIDCTHRWRGLA